MENIVYNELLVRGYNVDVGIVDVFAKNSEGNNYEKFKFQSHQVVRLHRSSC